MKAIVMGYGRVGEQLTSLLVDDGYQVTVIDSDPKALAKVPQSFLHKTVLGVGFDRDVLVRAGVEQADAFAATSASDNANIIAARIARNIFRVPRVVARLYDPRRAEIYQHLGLLTISSTTWGAERIRELLTHSNLDPVMTFGSGDVCLLSVEVTYDLVGKMVKHLTIPGEVSVTAITRQGHAFIPLGGTEFREGDTLQLVVLATAMSKLSDLLGLGDGG